MHEPPGHRGHPTFHESLRARRVGEKVGVMVAELSGNGFSHEESVAFLAGAAYEHARSQGECWSSPSSAMHTVSNLLYGYAAAKNWSMDAIEAAIRTIREELM